MLINYSENNEMNRINSLLDFSYKNKTYNFYLESKKSWDRIENSSLKLFYSKEFNPFLFTLKKYPELGYQDFELYIDAEYNRFNYPFVEFCRLDLMLINPSILEFINGDWTILFPELAIGYSDDEVEELSKKRDNDEIFNSILNTLNEKKHEIAEPDELIPTADDLIDSNLFKSQQNKFLKIFNLKYDTKRIPTSELWNRMLKLEPETRSEITIYMAKYLVRYNAFEDYWQNAFLQIFKNKEEAVKMAYRYYYIQFFNKKEVDGNALEIARILKIN